MITRQEIRIGNTIKQGVVDCIHPHAIEILDGKIRRFLSFEEAEPMPLYEITFESLKFKAHGNNIFSISLNETGLKKLVVFRADYSFKKWGIGFADYYTGKEQAETMPLEIESLHQLENLYFALSGVEITETLS